MPCWPSGHSPGARRSREGPVGFAAGPALAAGRAVVVPAGLAVPGPPRDRLKCFARLTKEGNS
jgi:hypothetical protein